MNENLENEMADFRQEITDDLGRRRKHEASWWHWVSATSKGKILILGAVGVFLLILFIALFSGGSSELPQEDLSSIQARLNQLEQRIARLEGMGDRIVFLEQQEKQLQQSMAETEESGRSLTLRLDKLAHQVDGLQKRVSSLSAETEAPLTTKRKPFAPAKGRYHEVHPGETLYRIARQYATSVAELCRLNNMTLNDLIFPGQKLLVPLP
jgi:LysM repeat protein